MNTKSVQLTEVEVKMLINALSYTISEKDNDNTNTIDRLKYLDKRLKDFKEPVETPDNENPTKKEPMSSW